MNGKSEALPTLESIASYVKKNTGKSKKRSMSMDMHHPGGQEVVRQDDYKGHHIVVRTTYRIDVDGKEVTGHLMLNNAGQVQYHGLPNMSFDSAVGLVRTLIDKFPEDFEKNTKPAGSQGGMSMPGMNMGGPTTSVSKPTKATKKSSKGRSK